jgi:hypothetical protein
VFEPSSIGPGSNRVNLSVGLSGWVDAIAPS